MKMDSLSVSLALSIAFAATVAAPPARSAPQVRKWSQIKCSDEIPMATDWIVLSPRFFGVRGADAEVRFTLIGAMRGNWQGLIAVFEDGKPLFSFSEGVQAKAQLPVTFRLYGLENGRHEIKVAAEGTRYAGFQICPTIGGSYSVNSPYF